MNNKSRELRVGALFVVGFLIIFGAIFVIGNQEGLFTKKFELNAKFVDVKGLTVGAPVRLGGVKVGSVKKIKFSPEDLEQSIIVEMEVNAESFIRIKKDSEARLGSQGLLGDRTVDLSVGSSETPPLQEGDYISSVETAQIDDIISKGGAAINDIKITAQNAKEISEKINHGDGSLAQIINDPRLYTNLDSLLNLWSDITAKINSGQGNLAKIVNDSSFYNNMTGSLGEIRTFLASANEGKGTLGRLVKEDSLYQHADSLLSSIDNMLSKINSGNGTAGKLIGNDDLYNKMNQTVDDLNALIIDIRQHPKKYVKISLF